MNEDKGTVHFWFQNDFPFSYDTVCVRVSFWPKPVFSPLLVAGREKVAGEKNPERHVVAGSASYIYLLLCKWRIMAVGFSLFLIHIVRVRGYPCDIYFWRLFGPAGAMTMQL